jgi:hypothetical protein
MAHARGTPSLVGGLSMLLASAGAVASSTAVAEPRGAAEARGERDCDEETSFERGGAPEEAGSAGDAGVPDTAGSLLTSPPIVLPCSVAESGVLGPFCADATAYLMTDTGIVLCEIALDGSDVPPPTSLDERLPSDDRAQCGPPLSVAGDRGRLSALPVPILTFAPPRARSSERALDVDFRRAPFLPS